MKKSGSYLSATALGSVTAVAALLVGLSGANAQAPAPSTVPLAGAGSFPGSFIVPGTNTSLHVGGIIQIDTTEDFDTEGVSPSNSPGAQQNEAPAGVDLQGPTISPAGGLVAHSVHGVFRINPNNTHPFFETRTPTPYGELKTFWEIDFAATYSSANAGTTSDQVTSGTNCCSNTSTPRLKQAYGTLGPWLIGMTNSNFADLDSLADTTDAFVEAGAFMGAGTAKEPQFRYTYLLPDGISLSGSVEEAQSAGYFMGPTASVATAGNGTLVFWNNYDAPNFSQRIPAFTAKARIDQPWGHAALSVAVQQERLDNTATNTLLATAGALASGTGEIPLGAHAEKWGFQVLQSGHFNTIGADKITWNIGGGHGAAQYSWPLDAPDLGGQYEEGLICSATDTTAASTGTAGNPYVCKQPWVYGVNVGYSHWWTSEWRSGVAYGYDHVTNPMGFWTTTFGTTTSGLNNLEAQDQNANVNIAWTPVPAAQFMLEFRWYHRLVWSGAEGTHEMIDFQTLWKF
jgi:hypothetical protein